MSKNSILNFRAVATQKAADDLSKLLLENEIPSEIEKESFNPASTFSEGSMSSNFTVKISSEYYDKAEFLMHEEAKRFLAEIDPEHYLFGFNDYELEDVLIKHHEWSEIDVLLSQKILEDRGIKVDPKSLAEKRSIRMGELATPTKGITIWIIIGYIFAFLGGLLGLAISLAVYKAKRKLPDGRTVNEYDETTRKHAKNIFVISLMATIAAYLYFFLGGE